jgi:hypothetical protein
MNKFYNNTVLQIIMIVILVCAETMLVVAETNFENQSPAIVEVLPAQGAAKSAYTRMARVTILAEQINVYTYRLTEEGEVVWTAAGQVEIGKLVKTGSCQLDGYAQIEYRDPERPGWWKVAYQRCNDD